MSRTPFPVDPVLTAIAIAYQNKRFIADNVLPRVTVGKMNFKYLKHKLDEGFTVPKTLTGRRGKVTEVTFSADEETSSVLDYGLDDPIPQGDIDDAPDNFNPLDVSTEYLTNLILLDREVRVAKLVFDAGLYNDENKKALTGQGKWSDYVNSDPVAEITNALDSVIMRPTKMTIGRKAFSTLAQHPKINKAVHGNSGDAGIANRRQIADLFELEEINVGEAYVNSAKKGKPADLQRAWGNHCLLSYHEEIVDTQRGTTFGITAQYGDRIAGAMPDPDIGLQGGQRNRVGEQVKELVTASDLAFFLENVI